MQLAADSGTTDIRIALDDEYVEAGFGKVCGICQTVVACADDNGVVAFHELDSAGFSSRVMSTARSNAAGISVRQVSSWAVRALERLRLRDTWFTCHE